jgi:hypothetical protein
MKLDTLHTIINNAKTVLENILGLFNKKDKLKK